MKTMLTLLLTLSLSGALLLGCTASAQSAADMEAGPAYTEPAQQPETLVKTALEAYDQEEGAAVAGKGTVKLVTSTASAVYHDLCAVCTDTDCGSAKHCKNREEWAENRSDNTLCKLCGADSCTDHTGSYNNHHGGHRHHNG